MPKISLSAGSAVHFFKVDALHAFSHVRNIKPSHHLNSIFSDVFLFKRNWFWDIKYKIYCTISHQLYCFSEHQHIKLVTVGHIFRQFFLTLSPLLFLLWIMFRVLYPYIWKTIPESQHHTKRCKRQLGSLWGWLSLGEVFFSCKLRWWLSPQNTIF